MWWDFRNSYHNNWVLISSNLIWIFLLTSFCVRMSLSFSKLLACLKCFLYVFHIKCMCGCASEVFASLKLFFLLLCVFFKEITFIAIFYIICFFYALLSWFYVFFFYWNLSSLRADHCLKYPQNTENRQSKADISGLTKFLKQQDRQDVQSYHYVGGYIFWILKKHILKCSFLVTLKKAFEYMF